MTNDLVRGSCHSNTNFINGYEVAFPPGKEPFPAQLAVMSQMLHALRQRKNALLESPTGTGKTLALLCAALAYQRQQRIDIATSIEENFVNNTEIEDTFMFADEIENAEHSRPPATLESCNISVKSDEPGKSVISLEKFKYQNTDDDSNDDSDAFETKYSKLKKRNVKNCETHENSASLVSDIVKPSSSPKKCIDKASLDIKIDQPSKKSRAQFRPEKLVTIVFASRTHTQIEQVIGELRTCESFLNNVAVNYPNPVSSSELSIPPSFYPSPFRMASLASRTRSCIHQKARKHDLGVDEGCRVETRGQFCTMRHGSAALSAKLPSVWDIEDLVEAGELHRACPYFAAKEALHGAQLILCPYNYVVDPNLRRIMGINLKNSIVLFDEAHNLADCCRESSSLKIDEQSIMDTCIELQKLIDLKSDISNYYSTINDSLSGLGHWLRESVTSELRPSGFESSSKTWSGEQALAIFNCECRISDLTLPALNEAFSACKNVVDRDNLDNVNATGVEEQMKMETLSPNALKVISDVITVVSFMLGKDKMNASHYKMVVIRERANAAKSRASRNYHKNGNFAGKMTTFLNIWCLTASVCFSDIAEEAQSVILTSGTLSPMEAFSSEMGIPFQIKLQAGHVIDVQQQCFVASVGTCNKFSLQAAYANQGLVEYQDAIGSALHQYSNVVRGGILVFFPSYSMLNQIRNRWEMTGQLSSILESKIVVEEPSVSSEVEMVMNEFNVAVEKSRLESSHQSNSSTIMRLADKNKVCTGAILLAVCRGKVSEGIDFSDDYARLVMMVGIPYPAFKDLLVKSKKEYQDIVNRKDSDHLNGDAWYRQEAFKAVNQAIGRCIRHKSDYGAIILADPRFKQKSSILSLSKWVRTQVNHFDSVESSLNPLRNFFENQAPMDENRTRTLAMKSQRQRHSTANQISNAGSKETSNGDTKKRKSLYERLMPNRTVVAKSSSDWMKAKNTENTSQLVVTRSSSNQCECNENLDNPVIIDQVKKCEPLRMDGSNASSSLNIGQSDEMCQ